MQMKLLGLIQKWGLNFEDKKNDLPNFYSVYNKLRNSNVQFPNNFESSYQIYISDSRNNYKNNRDDNRNDEYENENSDKDDKDGETFYYMESLKNVLKVPNFEHKYRRLVNFLVKMHDNIQMANLLIDSRERSGLKDIINTLREGNNTLIDTISGGRLKDEKLMEITLGTTEDINQTLSRDEDVKTGYKPKKFTSYFVLNNVIPIKNEKNYKSRAKSTKNKKSIQRRDEKYKNYDMDLNTYDRNKYKEKIGGGGPKNVDDIFDLFSAPTKLSNEPGYNQQQNNQPINNFFSSQTQIRGNNNNNQMPQLTNNPMNNIFRNNNGSNNQNINSTSFNNNNFQGNNVNNSNNFRNQFNQNKNQQMPAMNNFDILEQKLKTINMEQNTAFNFNSQSTQFNPGFNNTNMNNNLRYTNNNNNNNDNLMSMLDKLGPSPQSNSNQLTPYIGGFNQNNNYNNNNNNQFNNFNNNMNNNQNNNNFNNNGNNNNNFNNNQNYNFNNNNQSNNFNNSGNNFNNNNNFNNTQFNNMNNNQNNNFGNNNNNQMGMSQNMNNNFGMGQNSNQQMSLEEMEKQRKLKELDDLF